MPEVRAIDLLKLGGNPPGRENKVRLVKMFGLAALAAVAAMAFVGASSATAENTVLCKKNVNPCPAGEKLENQHIEGVAKNSEHPLLLSTSLINVICEESKLLGEVLTLANPLLIHVSLFDFTGCTVDEPGGSACDVLATALGLLLLLKTGNNVGTLQAHNTNVLVECGSFIHCVYGGLPTVHALGGSPGVIETKNVALTKVSGFFCPNTSNWLAKYKITLPTPAFITT